ncbi:MAG TPA: hypothetical protein EYQ46_09420 [Myxococcales bacterium]|nr:hypothetical protein [Myxococcales bacterium]
MNLKPPEQVADVRSMFMPCTDQAYAAESAILACCPALNSPVVNIEGLEVGSAEAAILLSADEYGDLTLRVRVKRVPDGAGVTFRYQGNASDFGNASAAMAVAHNFAEGMGFLFDEDMMRKGTGSSRRRAFELWNAILAQGSGGPATEAGERAPKGPSPQKAFAEAEATPEPVLDLEDALTLEDEAQVLTKLRPKKSKPQSPSQRKIRPPSRMSQPTASKERAGSGELGRMELSAEELGNEFVDVSGFLTRLLSSF